MLSFIIRVFLILTGLWFFRNFIAMISRGGSRQRRRQPTAEPTPPPASEKMVRDPVCGMYMDYRLAMHLEAKSGTLYFCSRECQQKYLSQDRG